MKTIKKYSLLFLVSGLLIIAGCKKADPPPPNAPTLTTTAVTNITTTTATSGGTITSNGGAEITASGIAWSKTNQTPTIADDITKNATITVSFTSNLTNLDSNATYYVRAYATNSAGTGYGNVVTFYTGNGAPEARNVAITGTVRVAEQLTATYTYFDFENDAESGTTIQWYRANDGAGAGEVVITGATVATYTLQVADESKFIRVGITPKSAAGTATGSEVKSAFAGPVLAAPTTVTFNYNGASVTYGIITSSVTGRRWLDRNLGAPNTPTAYNNFANYGDAFQWGRGADGHQLVNRAATSGATTGVNGTTTTLSPTDNPGHNLFIITTAPPFDWRSTQNDNLWQGVNGINNPCPQGWRIPTKEEWEAENLTGTDDGYSQLKLTNGGLRDSTDGTFSGVEVYGLYWSATIAADGRPHSFYNDVAIVTTDVRATGGLCRCIKD